jgi:SAM-dependent methyltransferase
MPLAYDPAEEHPLLAAFGLAAGPHAPASLAVDAEDEMLIQYLNLGGQNRGQALVLYFDSGRRIWATLAALLRWRFPRHFPGIGDPGRPFRLLDFASGYGRVTRYAVRDLPPERIWVADIYERGVRFQEETFGVHGLVSQADPERFECAQTFDAILVSSLFTHLPEATFRAWFHRLYGSLSPGGMLVFSVHDADLLAPGRALPPSGLLFDPSSESGSLPAEQYGTTYVDEPFVRRVLAELAPGASVHRIPRGLNNFQDLYAVVPEAGCDFSALSALRVRAEPEGFVEHCSAPAGRLRLAGWVADRARRQPPRELRVTLGGTLRHTVAGGDFTARLEVGALFPYEQVTGHGWTADLPLTPADLEANPPLAIEVVDAAGETSTLYADSLQGALLRSARLDLYATGRRLEESAAEIAAERRRIDGLHGLLRERDAEIAAMRASRFWKLRNVWFRVKRGLGLTREE